MRSLRATGAIVGLSFLLGACGPSSSSGPSKGGSSASGSSASGSASAPAASAPGAATTLPLVPVAAPGRVPLVLVHGIDSQPEDWETFCHAFEAGRPVVRSLYAAEADALAPGSLAPDVVVAFGFYRERAGGPITEDASIGGCPVARTDGHAALFPASYAARLRRGVEGIRRATGAPRVDLVLHSMGGIVGRAYTKWLSLDARGESAVRRIFTIGSPARGVNALEASASAFSHTGPLRYRRLGECLELCRESDAWGKKSFVELLNEDWDPFCAAHGIEYAGLSLLGEKGAPAGLNPTAPGGIPPAAPLPGGGYSTGFGWAIQQFVAALGTFSPSDVSDLPLLGWVVANLPSQSAQALDAGDGIVRLESSRLDQAPFGRTSFYGFYEGAHANLPDPERGFASSYAIECVRTFCLDSGRPAPASCRKLEVEAVRAPGRATWLAVTVDLATSSPDAGACALQVVEETLDANGTARFAIGYGSPLRPGLQTIAIALVPGGGTRRYRVQAYGPHGPIGLRDDLVLTLDAGAVDPAPRAEVVDVAASASAPPRGLLAATPWAPPGVTAATARVTLGAATPDPALAFRVRVNGGAWSDWSPETSRELGLLPGLHRLEVLARSAANGAQRLVEQGAPTAVGLRVAADGTLTLVR